MGRSIFESLTPNMPAQMPSGPQFANPIQKAAYIMQALTNPAAFVKQQFPDIPDEIANNANAILSYLQKTRGITLEQIQQLQSQNPYGGGGR